MNKKHIVAASIALFILSLACPAIRKVSVVAPHDLDPANISTGLYLLALGWTGVFAGIFAWLANPLFAVGVVFCLGKDQRMARWLLVAAVVFALLTLIHVRVPFQSDTGGSGWSLLVLMPGFYVWFLSLFLAAIGAWLPAPAPARQVASG